VIAETLYQIADELRAIANEGAHFTENEYDRERYARILALSARIVGCLEARPAQEVLAEYEGNLAHVSPIIGTDAVIYQDDKVFLIQRADNQRWGTPGGLTNVGETLAQGAQRELWEETGIRGRPKRLLGIFDSRLWGSPIRFHLYHVVFEFEAEEIEFQPSNETLDGGFFGEDNLPPLHPGHDQRLPVLFKLLRGELPTPYFDPIPD